MYGHSIANAEITMRSTDLTDRLRDIAARDGRNVFTTSFGIEDQLIAHHIFSAALDIDVVTLDSGRLFPEAYDLWGATEDRYGVRIRPYYPDAARLEALVGSIGINGFYDSKQARADCCGVRKVEPLARALAGAAGWVTGLRGDQSTDRAGVTFEEHDDARGLTKFAPLYDWTRDEVVAACEASGVPINPLHAKGFLSIGCAPCTRAVAAGEPERAGRWWWEQESAKECGLHVGPDGRLVRARVSA